MHGGDLPGPGGPGGRAEGEATLPSEGSGVRRAPVAGSRQDAVRAQRGPVLAYHWLRLRTTCHATEDPEKVRGALRAAAGTEALDTAETPLDSHYGGTVLLLEAKLDRSRALRDAVQRILDLPGALDELRSSLEARTDDDGVFYVRLDKQEAAQGRLALTRGEDAVQLRLKLQHHPATREAALAGLRHLLESGRA